MEKRNITIEDVRKVLTPSKFDFFKLWAKGVPLEEISKEMSLTHSSAQVYRYQIKKTFEDLGFIPINQWHENDYTYMRNFADSLMHNLSAEVKIELIKKVLEKEGLFLQKIKNIKAIIG